MQFIDKVKVHVKAGNGGDGVITFRREKYVPFGGPNGGDGGDGGSIIFCADTNRSTLLDLRYNRVIKAQNGERGKNKNMYGASAEDVVVYVPVGTLVKDLADNRILADLTKDGQREVICQGGKGGKGNRHFATSRNTVPERAEIGTPGEERDVEVELKVLADVGLIGYPSVGKSTLLSVVSAARPEIADYPFTTLTPQLGSVRVDKEFSFVMADLPGLIEGASQGKGLGFDFLKHIERCRLLIHVLDMGHEDPIADYETINKELLDYPGNLEKRPQLVLANKMDEIGAEEKLTAFRLKYPDVAVFPAITLLREGVDPLLYEIKKQLPSLPVFALYDKNESAERKVFVFNPKDEYDYEIILEKAHSFLVKGDRVERMLANMDLHDEDDALRFARILKNMGIEKSLREKGCQDGDLVTIGNISFDFIENNE